jgi:hypothetical protein
MDTSQLIYELDELQASALTSKSHHSSMSQLTMLPYDLGSPSLALKLTLLLRQLLDLLPVFGNRLLLISNLLAERFELLLLLLPHIVVLAGLLPLSEGIALGLTSAARSSGVSFCSSKSGHGEGSD